MNRTNYAHLDFEIVSDLSAACPPSVWRVRLAEKGKREKMGESHPQDMKRHLTI